MTPWEKAKEKKFIELRNLLEEENPADINDIIDELSDENWIEHGVQHLHQHRKHRRNAVLREQRQNGIGPKGFWVVGHLFN